MPRQKPAQGGHAGGAHAFASIFPAIQFSRGHCVPTSRTIAGMTATTSRRGRRSYRAGVMATFSQSM
ncbi:MAG: hypothetical protein MZV70_63415 [Desulfobacterales bacterium]|nr:hypothetical protein [Desulfobacterales bacterium]